MKRSVVELVQRNLEHARSFQSRFDAVQSSQRPDVVTVCCSDSRVLSDHIWGNDEPGRIFSCRNIGNRVAQRTGAGTVVSGDVLYPIRHTGTETVVVVGHTDCGAVSTAYDALTTGVSEPPGIDHCIELVKRSLAPGVEALPSSVSRGDAVSRLVEYNVDRQVQFLIASDDVPPEVDVVGVVYDFTDVYSDRRGEVHLVNVNGETDVEVLRDDHPDVAPRIERIWTR